MFVVVRSPRFEPGSSAWQADVLDQTRLRPHAISSGQFCSCDNLFRGLFPFPKERLPFFDGLVSKPSFFEIGLVADDLYSTSRI